MYKFSEIEHIKEGYDPNKLIFVGDIGGTHCNFAIVQADKQQVKLIISLHFLSKEISRFSDVVSWTLEHTCKKYNLHDNLNLSNACFAVAGPVGIEDNVVRLTNLPWHIDLMELKERTSLKNIKIINDFEAIGYGIDLIDQKDILCICKGKEHTQKKPPNKIVIGAGTGLGKSILTWDENKNYYISIPSEGGHADFPMYNQEEFNLIKYIHANCKKETYDPVVWEDVLSGKGISSIYRFLLESKSYSTNDEIAKSQYDASIITSYKATDDCSKETLALFTQFYGRCAKNLALEVFALGGVYIAGGIAVKNPDIFKEEVFLSEFLNNKGMKLFLEKIPVYVVTDYNVSLYGAAKSYIL
jgi:glucokinase